MSLGGQVACGLLDGQVGLADRPQVRLLFHPEVLTPEVAQGRGVGPVGQLLEKTEPSARIHAGDTSGDGDVG